MNKLILNVLKLVILTSLLYALILSIFYTDFNWSIEVLNPVYCEGTDDESSSKKIITEMVDDAVKKSTNINHNVNIEVTPSIGSAIKLAAGAFSGYVSLTGAAQLASYVPHPWAKVAAYVGGFGAISGVQKLLYNSLNTDSVYKTNSNIDLNKSTDNDKVLESLKVPSVNQSENPVDSKPVANSMYESEDWSFFINSVTETTSSFEGMLDGMIILAITGLYLLISLGLSLLTRELKLEEKEFIKSRPILLKLATLGKHSSRVGLLVLYLLIFFCLLVILISLLYLKAQLPIRF